MRSGSQTNKVTVLLVEDNPGDARLIRELLADPCGIGFELEVASTLKAGFERLARGGIALVLLDLSLPDSHGIATFARTHEAVPDVPIIVMSGLDDESLAIQTVQEGAQDYLVKGFAEPRLLVRAMRYAIERKHAEEALASERDLFHTLMDNLPDRIYFKDAQSRFTRINRAVAEQFKLAHPREAVNKTDFDFFAPEHAAAALADERTVMETGRPVLGKVEREVLPDGSVTWALTTKLPLKDKAGRIIGNFGISRDITQIKQIEDQLESERNLLRSLIDNLPDYIYVKDRSGRFLLDNVAHRRFLGASTEQEVVGRTLAEFFPAEVTDRLGLEDQAVVEAGRPLLHREDLIVDRFGQERWHSVTKVPLRNAYDQIIGLVGIARDITGQKESEQRLQQTNAELGRSKNELERVFGDLQRSHEELKSAQDQLIQAEKMQSVGRLAAGVAHEVKNPLGILRMGVDYLAANVQSPDANIKLILTDMTEAIRRADMIIMGLLDFSAPHALDSHPEDIRTLLDQSVVLVRGEFSPGVHVERDYAPDLPKVWIDRNKVKQVLVNVLTNAAHAMPKEGHLVLRLRARQLRSGETEHDAGLRLMERFRDGDRVVVIEILDSGPGIPPEKLSRVFDPFYTTKPPGKGTGLGLTVTRKIVELHGGLIEVRNRKEGGVCVVIMFKV